MPTRPLRRSDSLLSLRDSPRPQHTGGSVRNQWVRASHLEVTSSESPMSTQCLGPVWTGSTRTVPQEGK